MFSKNVAIRCPYCGAGFSIPVGAKYISTEAIAIDKSRNLPGQNTICPNPRCYRDIFYSLYSSLANTMKVTVLRMCERRLPWLNLKSAIE